MIVAGQTDYLEGAMHDLADKNKYVGFLFMRISPEYFALGRGASTRCPPSTPATWAASPSSSPTSSAPA
ncbi:hypothetical protein NKG94_48525 [Micromonospora sp. M12]